MCFLFVSLIETNCFIKENKLFLLEKQNVSTCETSSETIAFKFFKSACFELSFGLFKGDTLLSMYRRCIARTSIHRVIRSYTMICRDNVGMYRQNVIFKCFFECPDELGKYTTAPLASYQRCCCVFAYSLT